MEWSVVQRWAGRPNWLPNHWWWFWRCVALVACMPLASCSSCCWTHSGKSVWHFTYYLDVIEAELVDTIVTISSCRHIEQGSHFNYFNYYFSIYCCVALSGLQTEPPAIECVRPLLVCWVLYGALRYMLCAMTKCSSGHTALCSRYEISWPHSNCQSV